MSLPRLDRPGASPLARAAPLVCWSLVVVVGSVVDPPTGGGVAVAGPLGLGADKWVHFGAYGVTAFLAASALRARPTAPWDRRLLAAVAVAVVLGGGVELVQATLPARTFSLADGAANALGAVVGAAAYVTVGRRREGA